jgi:hypothetical protein
VHDVNVNVLPSAQFEMPGYSGEIATANTDAKGRFAVAKVPDGCYSFLAQEVARKWFRETE